VDANWHWVTGEAWAWTNWRLTPFREPNDGGDYVENNGENTLMIGWPDTDGTEWNDAYGRAADVRRYLVEFEAPSPVPEPASCALLALAVGGIGAIVKRRRTV